MSALFSAVLGLVYPPQCMSCEELVDGDQGLCGPCWRDTPFISGAICDCCGAPLMGGFATERATCDECLVEPRPWSQGRAALVYRDRARRMVLGLKHGGKEEIVGPAAAWMAQAGREILTSRSLIVPVPLHWSRLVKRRYNQAALLAKATADAAGCEVSLDALKRTRATQSLDHMSPDDRFSVLSGSISAGPSGEFLKGRDVVLLDDVMTSGATYAAATDAALRLGASRVDVLTLARAVREP
ncbi:MAG: ComF family protein [Pseudomonadota bacterium]